MANLGALPRLSALSVIPLQIETNLGFLSIYFFSKGRLFSTDKRLQGHLEDWQPKNYTRRTHKWSLYNKVMRF